MSSCSKRKTNGDDLDKIHYLYATLLQPSSHIYHTLIKTMEIPSNENPDALRSVKQVLETDTIYG